MRDYRNSYQRIFLCLTALSFLACSCNLLHSAPDYTLSLLNWTGNDLDDVGAYYHGKPWGISKFLVSGGLFTMDGMTTPIPPVVELKLVEHGQRTTIKVDLQNVSKQIGKDGEIMLIINKDHTAHVKLFSSILSKERMQFLKSGKLPGEYHFGFVNKTGQNLEEVMMTSENGSQIHPNLGRWNVPSDNQVAYSDALLPPIPSELEMRWKQDGKSHKVQTSLTNVMKGFEGIIYIVIKTNDIVEVHAIKNGNNKAALRLEK